MKHVPVSSATIVSVAYDSDNEILEIKFKAGTTYQYFGLAEQTHKQLMGAPSTGKFFHRHIRGKYGDKKI